MKKKPRFFCDHCGAEVSAFERKCPLCGRFFSAVRCPKCGFSGEEAEFSNGCPSCGYSSRQNARIRAADSLENRPQTWLYIAASGVFILLLSIIFLNLF
ncbi:MAG: zinc ribbon domain-containing protein [Spirochaetaceae bacterium]|jgi:uncharacterized membrane protein YvbJ|nr:zinc ribbon domain-containing protein [Spirochaetaceae bacterium]GMO30240.1 MAG: hypothetical protein Pg6A_19110 [Termitinemataceae bacterium]